MSLSILLLKLINRWITQSRFHLRRKNQKKSIKWAGIIAARVAKNRKLAKQLNQRKIYLFFSKSSMKKHRKNKAFVLLNPTFKDIIGYQTSYDTSNSVYYTVNKKTGNFKCVSKSDKKIYHSSWLWL